jgi:hypothetical protein
MEVAGANGGRRFILFSGSRESAVAQLSTLGGKSIKYEPDATRILPTVLDFTILFSYFCRRCLFSYMA